MTDPKDATLDSEWVTATVASKLLGIPQRRVARLGERGDVQRRLSDPNAKSSPYVYYVPELRQFASGEHAPDPQVQFALTQARLLEMATNTIREQWKLMTEPMIEQQRILREENADLRAHQKTMGDQYMELLKLREDLVDQKHTRELADQMARESADLKRDALGLLKKAAPFIWGGVLETLSRKQAFGALRAALTPEQVEVILAADVLTEDQKELFSETFKTKAPPVEPEPEEGPPHDAS